MYKKCATETSAARQRQLEQGLLAAMSKRRYEEITVSDLCQELGIPRKSFYRYFSGKEGALHALIDHTILEFESEEAPRLRGREDVFREGITSFIRFWQKQKPLLDALHRSGMSGILIERIIVYAVEDVTDTLWYLMPDMKQWKTQASMFAACGLMSLVVQWHHEGYAMDVEEMSRLATQLLTGPIFSGGDES